MSEGHLTETWKAIEGWTDYQVSDFGRVRSRLATNGRRMRGPAWRIIDCPVNQFGYRVARLGRQEDGRGQRWRVTVHRLVLEAFVGPRPSGLQACHADDDKDNNRLSNLRWDTPKANSQDRLRNGKQPPPPRGERNGQAKLTEDGVRAIRSRVTAGTPRRVLAAEFRVSKTAIRQVVRRKSWTHI